MPSRWTHRRQQFRAVLEDADCIVPASVFDPLSARIAEDLGYELGMFAGSLASQTVLAAPDLIVLTLSEFVEQAYRVCGAGELAVLADADHGYGNALNVARTVEQLEAAGIAGLTMEDTALPRGYGGGGGAKLLSIDEGLGKMRAALAARSDPNLAIVGRTSAAGITGMDDALARAQAYEAAGVDALFLLGVKDRAEIENFASALTKPLIMAGVMDTVMTRDELAAHNVRICLRGHQTLRAAVKAVYDTMKALRDGTSPNELANLASPELMARLTRVEEYERKIADYMGGDKRV